MAKFDGAEFLIGLNNKESLLPVFAFGSIGYWAQLLDCGQEGAVIRLEIFENFIKQSPRSRFNIYGPNGIQTLGVLLEQKSTQIPIKDIKLSYDEPWPNNHLKALKTAYSSSPFYEYFEADMIHFYSKKRKFLVEFNLGSLELVNRFLNLQLNFQTTNEYVAEPEATDFRTLSKKDVFERNSMMTYNQVFMDQGNPFIPNLSILDLIFNEGPAAVLHLKSQ